MLAKDTVLENAVERVFATKRIKLNGYSKDDGKGKSVSLSEKDYIKFILEKIFEMIDEINSTPEFTTILWNKPISEIMVPKEFESFILPESVRLDPSDLRTNNLLEQLGSISSNDINSYMRWIDYCLIFRSFFKKDCSENMVSLSSLRVPKSFADVLPIATFSNSKNDDNQNAENSLRSLDEPFIPIRLKHEIRDLFRSDYFNSNVYQQVSDFMAKWLLQLKLQALGPILHSKDWRYVGVVYPWYVFEPLNTNEHRTNVPELRYLAAARYLDDETNEEKRFKRKLPDYQNYARFMSK